MQVSFTKMQGLGNDFIVIDARHQPFTPSPELIRRLSHRRTGIGFDQALVLESPREPDSTAFYRILNADGGEVEQCGNGARCIARFLDPEGEGKTLVLESIGGRVTASVLEDGNVRVNMGEPHFLPKDIPLEADRERDRYCLDLGGQQIQVGAVSMGNPHAVLRVDDVDTAPVAQLGPVISAHPQFPQHTNAGFMEIAGKSTLKLRVYERGVGETLACGTGACAAAVVARRWGEIDETVDVLLPGGRLQVSWSGPGQPVWMSGPAAFVFEGTIKL